MADLALNLTTEALGTPAFFDLALTPGGDLALSTGPDAIAQAINQRLRAFIGDWFLALEAGTLDLAQFGQRQQLSASLEAVLQDAILATPGVLELTTWSASLNSITRVLNVQFDAQVDGGTISFAAPIDTTGNT